MLLIIHKWSNPKFQLASTKLQTISIKRSTLKSGYQLQELINFHRKERVSSPREPVKAGNENNYIPSKRIHQ
jgi:hypothetical protein